MRGSLNDMLRAIIAFGIRLLGCGLSLTQRWRIYRFPKTQKKLKRRYRLGDQAQIESYEPTLARINSLARDLGKSASFAFTSGSTTEPKRILYTRKRLRTVKWVFSDMFARACWSFGIRRTTLYVFSSFSTDNSLTNLLLQENQLPNYFITLQAPYRVQRERAIQQLATQYGTTAVRLWLLALTNPGVLYSTNPSTISTFLDEVINDWNRSKQMVQDWCENETKFPHSVRKIARRLESRNSKQRLTRIAQSDKALAIDAYAPAVRSYICWTGGYVQPFLERLRKHLPEHHFRLIPMYSMSTETIETETCFRTDVSFLPITKGVVYEFLEEQMVDVPANLIGAREMVVGKHYTMVVTDAFGLRRYQTEDVFSCESFVAGLPNLKFLRRRNLEYSFTGEKLTANQLSAVFEQLKQQHSTTLQHAFLTCIPCNFPNCLPHYRILAVESNVSETHFLARQCDELLSQSNVEYRDKRLSGRLGPPEFVTITTAEFVALASSSTASWETQFKLLPLYRDLIP